MIKASAPGSLMLLGEHAVLYHHPALVVAIKPRIEVTLTPFDHREVEIQSILGYYRSPLDQLSIKAPLDYALAAIQPFCQKCKTGFALKIQSNFPAAGLGSSTAVVVAITAVMIKWLGYEDKNADLLFHCSLQAIRAIQTDASGADAAASIYGGVLYYTKATKRPKRAPHFPFPLCWIDSREKTPTQLVIEVIKQRFLHRLNELKVLYQSIGLQVNRAWQALCQQNLARFIEAVNQNQNAMEALGVCHGTLTQIVSYARQQPHVSAAKISGAGLGDGVVVFGRIQKTACPYPLIPMSIDEKGCFYASSSSC